MDFHSNDRARRVTSHAISGVWRVLRLLTKYEASGNAKALALIKKMSPAAWRHIHLNGHYTFRGDGQLIDLDAIVAELVVRRKEIYVADVPRR